MNHLNTLLLAIFVVLFSHSFGDKCYGFSRWKTKGYGFIHGK